MIEKRWILTGIAAAALLLPAAGPVMASGCGVTWSGTLVTGDINGDDLINGVDLGMLLGDWGSCTGCASDFNEDDVVGCVDQEFLLGNWGQCVAPSPELLDQVPGMGCGDLEVLLNSLGPCTGVAEWSSLDNGPYSGLPIYDVDNSGMVTGHDVEIVRCLLGTGRGAQPFADFDSDGTVDDDDLELVEGALGQKCPDLNQDGKLGWPDVYVLIKRWP